MYVKAAFCPLREFMTGLSNIHAVAAGAEKPRQQHEY
jgi:hypothetical protein